MGPVWAVLDAGLLCAELRQVFFNLLLGLSPTRQLIHLLAAGDLPVCSCCDTVARACWQCNWANLSIPFKIQPDAGALGLGNDGDAARSSNSLNCMHRKVL